MARVEIDIPEKFDFDTTVMIRVGELNYGGHMANESIASYVNEARFRFIKDMGFVSEVDIDGVSLIMADSATIFKNEGFFGDEINIKVAVKDIRRSSFEMIFVFENNTQSNVLAISKAGMVFFDYEHRKVVAMPDSFKAKFAS